MGVKGDKMTATSAELAAVVEEKLATNDGFKTKKMFGGFGLFHEDKMFGIIDSKGGMFVKGDKSKKEEYLAKGAVQHSRMPYFSIDADLINDYDAFIERVDEAIKLSKS